MSASVTLPGGATVSIPFHQAGARPKYVPKISYLPTRSGDTSQVWKSSGVFLDYLLPKNVGILNNVRFRFQTNNSSTAFAVLPPASGFSRLRL